MLATHLSDDLETDKSDIGRGFHLGRLGQYTTGDLIKTCGIRANESSRSTHNNIRYARDY